MYTDARQKPRYSAPRAILVASISLVAVMGFLYFAQTTQTTGFDKTNHTITITTQFAPSHDSTKMEEMSHMDMAAMTHYDEGVWVDKEFTVPEDIWLTDLSTDFTGESVHNFYVFVKDTHDAWCPENPTAIFSGGTVSSKRPISFDPPYGIFIKKGTTLILRALYHDSADETTNVAPTFSIHAKYEPASISTRTIPVSLFYITPGPCVYTRPVFPVPAHAQNKLYSSDDKPFEFPEDGVILKAMAHFHAAYTKGVTNTVSLLLNKKGIDSFTTTNVGDDAERNPRLLTDKLVTVRKGDILTMHAIFSNPSAIPVPEGMAIIGFYFAPQKQ